VDITFFRRNEVRLLALCMALLAAAAGWLLSTRPGHRIEGDFMEREQAGDADIWLLGQAAGNPVAEERALACLALGRIGGEVALERLGKALSDPAPSVRKAAAFGLGLLGDVEYGARPDPKAAEALIAALDDSERAVVAYAVEALGKMRWKPAAVRLTSTPAPYVFTLTALARINDERLLPWMAGRLRSSDQDVRWAAAVALNYLEAPCEEDSQRPLINLVTRDQNGFVRAAAARALGRCKPSDEVRTAIAAALNDKDPKVRGEAAGAVADWGDPALADWLDPLARDENPIVQRQALIAAVRLEPELRPSIESQIGPLDMNLPPETPRPSVLPGDQVPDFEPPEIQAIARTRGRQLVIETTEGELPIELDYDQAPLAAERFYRLATSGAFELREISALRPDGYLQVAAKEFAQQKLLAQRNPQPFLRGSIGMVPIDGRFDAAELFIALTPSPFLDGRATNIGRVLSGDDILDKLGTKARILAIRRPR
jgi:HEAT repeat protein